MKEYIINGDIYTQVADFIRTKDGSTDTINPKNFINKFFDISNTNMPNDIIDNFISSHNITEATTTATKIKDHMFYNSNITNLNMPNVSKIGYFSLFGCTNLALTSLPESLVSIARGGFGNCTNLALTSLPEGLLYIGDYAFQYCTGLTSITFKGTPSTISSSAFMGCTNLTTINAP